LTSRLLIRLKLVEQDTSGLTAIAGKGEDKEGYHHCTIEIRFIMEDTCNKSKRSFGDTMSETAGKGVAKE